MTSAMVNTKAAALLPGVDAVVFDCDGVLVDVSESYDAAIKATAARALREFAGIAEPAPVTDEMIEALKCTGGFNDEVDLTYAASLIIAAAAEAGRGPAGLAMEAAKAADPTGIPSVERYLDGIGASRGLRDRLGYPGERGSDPLRAAFDEAFYGPELFSKIYGKESRLPGPGLIERDRVLLEAGTLEGLNSRFGGRVSMVTGRGEESARHALGRLMDGFDVRSSFFLEDHPREMAKPSPEALVRSMESMGSSRCLYVGDSVEDLLMAQRATEAGSEAVFCGVIGACRIPLIRMTQLHGRGAGVIMSSVSMLPNVLNQVCGGGADGGGG